MIWERVLRMLGIHHVPLPDLTGKDPALEQAQAQVEQLHRKAEKVLDDYAAADEQRVKNGRRKH